MEENEARRLARRIADMLGSQIRHIKPEQLKFPITLAEILMVGLHLTAALRSAYPDAPPGGFPVSQELLTPMYQYPEHPEAVEEMVYRGLVASDENPMDLDATIDMVTTGKIRHDLRKEMRETLDVMFPPGPPGKSKSITEQDFPRLVERCERYQPLFLRCLQLQEQYPSRTIDSLLEFLKPDYPMECAHIEPYLPKLLARVDDCSAYEKAKTVRSKARIMADVMAGIDFGLAPTFALQQAQMARRFVRGKERSQEPRTKKHDR